MTESEWLRSTDPAAMMQHLQRHSQPSDRKFQAVCCVLLKPISPDPGDYPKFPAHWLAGWIRDCKVAEKERACSILRDIFGNPFRPKPNWKRCVLDESKAMGGNKTVAGHPDRTVFTLAQSIYDHHNWSAMPALHDALVDAGCDNEELLTHLQVDLRPCLDCSGTGKEYYGSDFSYQFHPCNVCKGRGQLWPTQHWRGCWAIDLILGKE